MEVEDVSHVRQWFEMLQKQKEKHQNAGKRQGKRPKDRKSRGQLIQQHMVQYASMKMMSQRNDEHLIHQSWVGPPYLPSVAPLEDLKKLYLKDLQLETHHRGHYVLLRTVSPPLRMTAVTTVMEDETDDVVMLHLYQQQDEEHRQVEDIIQLKDVCLVKEPYFKIMNDGGYGLRVDHISDFFWLSKDDDRVPLGWRDQITEIEKDAKDLKNDGNTALRAGRLSAAVHCYTSALRYSASTEDTFIIKLDRSLANLKLRCYDKALKDAVEFPPGDKPSEKGLYRAARCLYELGRFQESLDAVTSLLAHYPNNGEAKKETLRVERRLREQEHGDYDFHAMYGAAKNTPPCLDHATYVGPVTIKASNGRGRGLFTTRDVVAGELLLCEKAFSYCYADTGEGKASSKTSILMNTHTDRMVMGTQPDLITATVQKMYRNPSLMPTFISLYHGDYKPVKETEMDGAPIVDTFLVDRIISINVFGCPRTTRENHFASHEQQKGEKTYHSCGIFVTASVINHSCFNNARRSFIGDMQLVRAARNIAAGAEVFFWYAIPETNRTWEKMQEKLQNWGFQCTCVMCQEDKKTPKKVFKKRTALLEDLKAAFQSSTGADLPKAERLLAAIEKTHSTPAEKAPRLSLWDPYLLLTHMYSSQNKQDKVIQTAWKVLASLGFVIKRPDPQSSTSLFEVEQWGLMEDHVVETWVHLWTAYAQLAPHLCKQAEECARTAYKICIGEDGTFDDKYGKLAQQAMSKGLDLGHAFREMRL